jgi:hypothetical protein
MPRALVIDNAGVVLGRPQQAERFPVGRHKRPRRATALPDGNLLAPVSGFLGCGNLETALM